MEPLKETTTIIKTTKKGDQERPALIHECCPGLAVTMSSFGRFTVTHTVSGKKICPTYPQSQTRTRHRILQSHLFSVLSRQ